MIVLICLSFFGPGAVMRRAREEVKALLNAGHHVTVITDLKYSQYLNTFKEFKNKPYIIPIKPFYLHPRPIRKVSLRIISRELSFAFQCYYHLKTLAKKESIDLIVSHQTTICYAVARFAKKNKIPSVFVIQELIKDNIATKSNPYNWLTTQLYKHSNRYALSNMHYSIAVSNYIKNLAIKERARPKNVFVNNNFVDTQIFQPDEEKTKDIDVLYIGRLSIEKGVNILINATKYLSRNRSILIIGDGILRKNLEYQAQHSKCNIKFQGWVEHILLPQFIQRAKIVVAPSLSEAHAAVPLEAMACGVPVIGSQAGGMSDTITHNKNGWLLKENNAKNLGKLIEKVLSDNKKLKLISQGALKKSEFFSKNNFRQRIVDLYENLIEKYNANN